MYRIKLALYLKQLTQIFALLLTSCSTQIFSPASPPIIDESFLTGETCDPPCWYGLEIDNSTKEDALSTLNQLPFIDVKSISEYETYWFDGVLASAIKYNCVNIESDIYCGNMIFYEATLKENFIGVYYELTLNNAVERLGTPDHLIYFWPSPYGSCEITVTWINKGAAIIVHDKSDYNECESIIDGNKVSPKILIDTILYTSPNILEEYYVNNPGTCCTTLQWPGFKE
jgi:hypothetical protein